MGDQHRRHPSQPSGFHPHAHYATPPTTVSAKQYPTAHSTSSAFSASANPNEDWTKISDLAERRRIQNRIAQRNYRKKLKKRLEDLERRAGSSSASPEQSHEELPQPLEVAAAPISPVRTSSQQPITPATKQRSNSNAHARRDRTPEHLTQQYILPSDDRAMFSQQYTRQISTSPPPFTYASLPLTEGQGYGSSYPPAAAYCNVSSSAMSMPLYQHYLPPVQAYFPNAAQSPPLVKHEYFADDEISPFSMSYASMAGVDVPNAQAYHHHHSHHHDVPAYS